MNTLPSTSKLFFPALFTSFRKATIKTKMDVIEKEFQFESFNQENINKYKNLLGYKDQSIPLTYLYLLAQRAQIALMLNKKFLFPLIGMVHMENEMESIKDVSDLKPLTIKVKSEQYFNEEKNRIEVNFTVSFEQDNEKIASCKSKYLAKQGKRPKSDKKLTEAPPKINFTQISNDKFKIPDARTYAHISGDYNFIHLSPWLAKLFGFRSSILHGMYLKGLMGARISNHTGKKLKKISVQFKKPLLLPNEVNGHITDSGEFKALSSNDDKEFVAGTFETH